MNDWFLFLAILAMIGFGVAKFAYAFGRASLGAEISHICTP